MELQEFRHPFNHSPYTEKILPLRELAPLIPTATPTFQRLLESCRLLKFLLLRW